MQSNSSMAIILEDMGKAKEKIVLPCEGSRMGGKDLIDIKLHAAQEILAEVFGITVFEAEEMIRERSREKTLWPERFRLEELDGNAK
jgi:hypothetical protein